MSDDRLTPARLTAWFAEGCKPADQFSIGAEHEKVVFHKGDNAPVPYAPGGIEDLLKGLTSYGWLPVEEGGKLIALVRDGGSVTLEPAGQFELSGAALTNVHDIKTELETHLTEAKAVGDKLGIGFAALGFTPTWSRSDVHIMPKGRYDIMRAYMPKKGKLGLDMMLRTCTVQSNLDFASEADMVAKFRTSLALQPIATALFANSPFVEGKPTGYLSSRANVWTDTDPDRTGMLDFVFEDGFGFERYAEYALDVPMYFVKRAGKYIDVSGQSFRSFLKGELPGLPGELPTIKDWADHITTIFPEVRLKQYLEMRGADTGPADRILALQALWAGVLYDGAALSAAWDLAKHWTAEDHNALRRTAFTEGLKGKVAGRTLQDVAKDLIAIAGEGLKARNINDGAGFDERVYLDPIGEIADDGITPAERLLEKFHGEWQGDASRAYEDQAY